MTLTVQATSTYFDNNDVIKSLFTGLMEKGYNPLIMQAKRNFISIFDKNNSMDILLDQLTSGSISTTEEETASEYLRRFVADREQRARRGSKVAGDIFFSLNEEGILYVLITEVISLDKTKKPNTRYRLEIGYLGDDSHTCPLDDFRKSVTEILSNQLQSTKWEPFLQPNSKFNELQKSEKTKFVTADAFSSKDIEFAEWLEDQAVRQVAIDIKSAGGGMLVEELGKNLEAGELKRITDRLIKTNLIVREYAIICQKTSKQISRVQSLEAIKEADKLGFTCTCGKSYSEENIKELFRPTSDLKKMLDKSYWVTARLVSVLRRLGVPDNCILLNLEEGPNEIDAALHVDGMFFMVELKDDEFAMGHAYRYGSRISIYKPDCAIIVSTKGVSPDVKEHFKRADQEADIVYVENLNEIDNAFRLLVENARRKRASEIISFLGPVTIPLSQILSIRIGVNLSTSS